MGQSSVKPKILKRTRIYEKEKRARDAGLYPTHYLREPYRYVAAPVGQQAVWIKRCISFQGSLGTPDARSSNSRISIQLGCYTLGHHDGCSGSGQVHYSRHLAKVF